MTEKYANNFSTTLAAAIVSTSATTITTAAAAPATLQSGEFRVLVDSEILRVTAGQTTTTWTVERGFEGTAAATHLNSAPVTHILTAGSLEAVNSWVFPFSQPGTLAVTSGAGRFRLPANANVINIAAAVGTAPTGASVIVDVNRNSASLFTVQADRPTIGISQTVSPTAVPGRVQLSAGDLLSVDVDQVGSVVAGSDLTVTLYLQKTTVSPTTYAETILATAGLISHWRLGESSGTVAADAKAANAGTYAGSPTLGSVGLITGSADTAVTFDGVDDQMFTANSINLSSSPGSLECWVNIAAANPTAPYVSTIMAIQPGSGNEFQLRLGGDGVLGNNGKLQSAANAGGSRLATMGTNLTLGVRHHIVATYNGSDLLLYLDGTLIVTNASGGAALNANGAVQVGGLTTFGDDRWLDGKIDEVAIYNTALSPATILEHYNAGA